MCFLVKEGSEIVNLLRVGETFRMKYYSSDSLCPTRVLNTEIAEITKEDQGRFAGHFLVYLSIANDINNNINIGEIH